MSQPIRALDEPVSTTISYHIETGLANACKALHTEVWCIIWSNLQLHLTRNAYASNHYDLNILPTFLSKRIRHIS